MFLVMTKTADIDSQAMPVAVFTTEEDAEKYSSAANADVANQHFSTKWDIPEFWVSNIALNPTYTHTVYTWSAEWHDEIQRRDNAEYGVVAVDDVNIPL